MLALMMNACMLKRAATIVNQAATPAAAPQAVLVPSVDLPADAVTIRGYDFNDGRDLDALLESMLRTGLQATALGQAINEINRMVGCQALE
jgi:deoxyhypusine synthase